MINELVNLGVDVNLLKNTPDGIQGLQFQSFKRIVDQIFQADGVSGKTRTVTGSAFIWDDPTRGVFDTASPQVYFVAEAYNDFGAFTSGTFATT